MESMSRRSELHIPESVHRFSFTPPHCDEVKTMTDYHSRIPEHRGADGSYQVAIEKMMKDYHAAHQAPTEGYIHPATMVNTRSTEAASQQGSSSSGLVEVPDSQFEASAGTATFQGPQGTPQGIGGQAPLETHAAIMATVERLVRERLAQEQRPQHTPPVHVMRGNKPQAYNGKSRSEFEEFIRVCEPTFLSAHWVPGQNIDKVAYATGFLMGTPASEWKAFKLRADIMTVTWDELKELLLVLLGDKANVEIKAVDAWYNAKQRPNQTIRPTPRTLTNWLPI
ncbi:hypothetical protein MMC07_007978 [Pseudocyphellaria aurata]|nr:hypothetical protein [Pseudocyphellaria aurata]